MVREAGRLMEAITVRGRSANMRETSELHSIEILLPDMQRYQFRKESD